MELTKYVFSLTLFAFFALLLQFQSSVSLEQESYRLGVEDQLHIKIFQWKTAEGVIVEWPAISGEYEVRQSGSIEIPFLGEIPVIGKSTIELADLIGSDLKETLGLIEELNVSIEISEYRPFFIYGRVRSPGKFPYAPGLTVQKALALSGGIGRPSEVTSRVERELINANGNIAILNDQYLRLSVKRARITSEISGEDIISPPLSGVSASQITTLVDKEKIIAAARQKKVERELSALNSLIDLLEKEIVALQNKTKLAEERSVLLLDEQQNISELAKKGFATNSELNDSIRALSDLESRILDLTTSRLRAEQELSKALQSRIAIVDGQKADLVQELQIIDAQISEVQQKIEIQGGLIAESSSLTTELNDMFQQKYRTTYVITRELNGEYFDFNADKNTPVSPGDSIEVSISILTE